MTDIWEKIALLLDQRPFQLFCTTHSKETIEAALPAFDNQPDRLRVFRLDRRGTGIIATTRDYRTVVELTAGGFELR